MRVGKGECVSKKNTQHRERETHKIFTWKPKSKKNHWEEEKNPHYPLVTGFTEIV